MHFGLEVKWLIVDGSAHEHIYDSLSYITDTQKCERKIDLCYNVL